MVLVQGRRIPFLIVLGFSPVLWTVIVAMTVRNSLMNAGNPIFNAFAMEQVTPVERATLSAAMSVLWQIGWVIGGTWYALLQATLGFAGGYTVNFITIIALYSIATVLYWVWFREADRRALAARTAVARQPAPGPARDSASRAPRLGYESSGGVTCRGRARNRRNRGRPLRRPAPVTRGGVGRGGRGHRGRDPRRPLASRRPKVRARLASPAASIAEPARYRRRRRR